MQKNLPYLKITNDGELQERDLYFLGASQSRQYESKIGNWGTGLKHALPVLVRNDATPVIFAGEQPIKVDFGIELYPDSTPMRMLTINDVETHITEYYAHDWKIWMAIREIVSNAIDQGGLKMEIVDSIPSKGQAGRTSFYIPCIEEVKEVYNNYDYYFSYNRKDIIYSCDIADVYYTKDKASVIYANYIRCIKTSPEWDGISVSFTNIPIEENRLASMSDVHSQMISLIMKEDLPYSVFIRFMQSRKIPNLFEGVPLLDGHTSHIINNLKKADSEGYLFLLNRATTKYNSEVTSKVYEQTKDAPSDKKLYIPSTWLTYLEKVENYISIYQKVISSSNNGDLNNKLKSIWTQLFPDLDLNLKFSDESEITIYNKSTNELIVPEVKKEAQIRTRISRMVYEIYPILKKS